ncbi:MAG: hypothetical protein WDN28_04130 [Chthoniobacter sp.]
MIAGRHAEFALYTANSATIALEKPLFTALVRNHTIEVSKDGFGNGWFVQGELMGKSLVGVPVTATNSTDGTSVLGPLWLCGFNVEIDLQSHTWRYQQRRNAQPPLTMRLMVGATFLYPGGGAQVEKLRPDGAGAAEKGGPAAR